jgi:hypothetical protein
MTLTRTTLKGTIFSRTTNYSEKIGRVALNRTAYIITAFREEYLT